MSTNWADRCFWPKVVIGHIDNCWPWTASRNRKGYGQVNRDGHGHLAHRVAYELMHGTIPDGFCVLHRCDNPGCVNPRHLFTGSKADNNADMMAKGRYARGETNGQSKLTRETAALIRAAQGYHHDIAKEFGVHQTTVTRVKAGQIWVPR